MRMWYLILLVQMWRDFHSQDYSAEAPCLQANRTDSTGSASYTGSVGAADCVDCVVCAALTPEALASMNREIYAEQVRNVALE